MRRTAVTIVPAAAARLAPGGVLLALLSAPLSAMLFARLFAVVFAPPSALLFAPPARAAEPAPRAAAAAAPIVIRDDRGTEHRFAAPPARIVTMMPSLTEAAWVLGAGGRLVGVDRYSNWPAEVARLPHLGGLEDAQIEAIAALKPDVVLASASSRAVERLEALGFRVVRLKSDRHADLQRTLDVVARLLGKGDEGARVWARLTREIAAAAARVPAGLRGRSFYFEVDGGPFAAGTTSFISETLQRLGLVNIVPADLGPFPKLSPEFVVRAAPEVILGLQREMAALGERPGWAAIPAVRGQRLCAFSSAQYDMLVRPGPRLGEAAARMADCLERLAPPSPRTAAAAPSTLPAASAPAPAAHPATR